MLLFKTGARWILERAVERMESGSRDEGGHWGADYEDSKKVGGKEEILEMTISLGTGHTRTQVTRTL